MAPASLYAHQEAHRACAYVFLEMECTPIEKEQTMLSGIYCFPFFCLLRDGVRVLHIVFVGSHRHNKEIQTQAGAKNGKVPL